MDSEVKCPGCHARALFSSEEVLQHHRSGTVGLQCGVCRLWFTPAEWEAYQRTRRSRAVMGRYAWVPASSEEFARRKREEGECD